MVQGTLKKPDGSPLITFDIPMNLSEVPLNRFIDFLVESRELSDIELNTAIATMAKAVSSFYGVDLATTLQAAAGVFDAGQSSFADSISTLYGHAIGLIGGFKPELPNADHSFEYKGERYMVPTIIKQALAGEFMLPGLSVAEVVEVAEIQRFRNQTTQLRGDRDGQLRKRFDDMVSETVALAGGTDENNTIKEAGDKMFAMELERAGDPDGSLALTYYLKTLAVLCRRENEQLPFEDSKREIWMQDRAVHFQGIDAATALTTDFFLTNISEYSVERPPFVGFLKNLSFATVAATAIRSATRLKGRSAIRNKRFKRSVGGK